MRQTLRDLNEAIAGHYSGSEHVLLSLLFTGRSVGDRTRCRGHFRMDRDALICKGDKGTRIFLPVSNMQSGMDEETFVASLPDIPAATWEIAPCFTWAVAEGKGNPVLMRAAFVDPTQCDDANTNVGVHLP
ncbi:hypothetical protein [Paraburkholderia caledonica]|uniref:Uncharacterized protein n=1 Tax=Paraburkholderia caledonica TaxID=134536 RepID=A0AB73IPD0_9BURK|nr:hypothetical protein [Paraburkholderia caledonica]